ncbi:tetratricopeptide repeat protein [uncultured Sphingomonas sp.]|uniref:tetratricopeptide repeat protein n=1 Tax=uncultured Sphingomonas sp. TaxID=158754 RepID=UPI002619B417|nr:tetratricopeptide repeat protein [uncultured Sphingomonas sp.]
MAVATPAVAANQPAKNGLLAYLAARADDGNSDGAEAVRRYTAALADAPGNADVALRAYREALSVGDDALVDRSIATLLAAGQAPADSALIMLAGAARGHDLKAEDAAIARLSGGQLAVLVTPLRAWAAQERGGDPLAILAQRPRDAVSRRLNDETRALILIARGQYDEGLTSLRAISGNDQAAQDLRIAAAQLLIGKGQDARARTLLTGDSGPIAALRDHPQGAKPTLAFGAARLFVRLADDLVTGDPGPLSITLTRAALRAEPGNDRARLLLAGTLARLNRTDRALAVLNGVDKTGLYGSTVDTAWISILAGAERYEDAIRIAAPLAQPADASDLALATLGDLLLTANHPKEALPVYRRLIERPSGAARWEPWLHYAAALDQAGDWPAAREALLRAEAIAPDEPSVLNYLGYGDITHNGDVPKALAMLQRAVALRPDDSAIVDSLGWAYYRSGDLKRALPLLEQAAQASPENAEIGEHLGDAYWRAGRRYEARYAWRAAQVVAEGANRDRLATKIADGL